MTENPPSTTDGSHPDQVTERDARADAGRSPGGSTPTTTPTPTTTSIPTSPAGRLETLVRDGEAVAATCSYCERPFATQDAHDLHVGEAHADACSTAERETYENALATEEDELFYFHLRVVAALAGLYTVLTLLYMVALGSGIL